MLRSMREDALGAVYPVPPSSGALPAQPDLFGFPVFSLLAETATRFQQHLISPEVS